MITITPKTNGKNRTVALVLAMILLTSLSDAIASVIEGAARFVALLFFGL